MGRNSNKKRFHATHERNGSASFTVSDALHSVKRRRLSDEVADATVQRDTTHHRIDGKNDNDGWQTVPSRKQKRQGRQHTKSTDRDSAYPSIRFGQQVTRPIAIEQLRDLALYVLADGTAPDWVAVNRARDVGKVVVMMLPGLDGEALSRAKDLLQRIRRHCEDNNPLSDLKRAESNDQTPIPDDMDDGSTSLPDKVDGSDSNTESLPSWAEDYLDLDQSYRDGWLFDHTFPVKAPGDTKYHKVHSPLQAMLMTPEVVDKTNPRHHHEKQSKANEISLTHFVHTSDELREAEYPIHPATFTSAADAELESSRRKQTGQSVADGWVDSAVVDASLLTPPDLSVNPRETLPRGLSAYAIDCEMVLTSDQKSSLARISLVSWPNGKVIIDKYVMPDLPIENYFTQYSGITPGILRGVTTTLSDIQKELLTFLTPSTILLGHSLESDLNALKMTHPFIVDTSMLYPHPRGLPLRSSLKYLANKYLRREIQAGGAKGHDSIEDARAVLDLVKLKCEKGAKFGTQEANGEPIFKRLSKHTRANSKPVTSAIVEYGSAPERGFGKDATYAIGCQNDEDIVAGMTRAIKGDLDAAIIPYGGADFVWGRLRALEYARGWVTNNNTNANNATAPLAGVETGTGGDSTQTASQPSQEETDKAILSTLRHVAEVRQMLPPTTLLILYNGISDVRPVLKLQAIQTQYRKEFKVKKWDELTVRWTDVEEQALRNAANKARHGWGWIGVS